MFKTPHFLLFVVSFGLLSCEGMFNRELFQNNTLQTYSFDYKTEEDVPIEMVLPAKYPEDAAVRFEITQPPMLGVLTVDASNGKAKYAPLQDANGSDVFKFRLVSGENRSDEGTITIAIAPVNDSPVGSNSMVTAEEDTPKNGSVLAVDVDKDPLTYKVTTLPTKGTVSLSLTTGAFTYTPNKNENGSDSFTFEANDGAESSAPAQVSLNITALNDAPIAEDGTLTTLEDIASGGKLKATDVDSASLRFFISEQGTKGTVTIDNPMTGAYTYTPKSNLTGDDSFTFAVTDGATISNLGTVTVSITPVADNPMAVSFTHSTAEDTVLLETLTASDPDSVSFTFTITSAPSHGMVTLLNNKTGAFEYTPSKDYSGSDSFSFRVNDGMLDSLSDGTLSINLSPENDAPEAFDGVLGVVEDRASSGTLSAFDVDKNALIFSVDKAPAKGVVDITDSSKGVYTYTPAENENGDDSFTFKASDGQFSSNAATVSVSISKVNDRPFAKAGTLSLDEDIVGKGQLRGADVENSALTFAVDKNGSSGTVEILDAKTGDYQYTPNANANGTDSFTFTVNDGESSSDPAKVDVTILPINDPPTVSDMSLNIGEAEEGTLTLQANDVDSPSVVFEIVSGPEKGAASLDNSKTILMYHRFLKPVYQDGITFRALDPNGAASSVGTVNVSTGATTVCPTGPFSSTGRVVVDVDPDKQGKYSWRISQARLFNDAVYLSHSIATKDLPTQGVTGIDCDGLPASPPGPNGIGLFALPEYYSAPFNVLHLSSLGPSLLGVATTLQSATLDSAGNVSYGPTRTGSYCRGGSLSSNSIQVTNVSPYPSTVGDLNDFYSVAQCTLKYQNKISSAISIDGFKHANGTFSINDSVNSSNTDTNSVGFSSLRITIGNVQLFKRPNGNLISVGTYTEQDSQQRTLFFVNEYLPTGQRNNNFGWYGHYMRSLTNIDVTGSMTSAPVGNSVAMLLPTGEVVAGIFGQRSNGAKELYLIKVNPQGRPVYEAGGGIDYAPEGIKVVPLGSQFNYPSNFRAIAMQKADEGNYVFAFYGDASFGNQHTYLMRVTSGGVFDPTFGVNGFVDTNQGSWVGFQEMFVGSTGKIYVVGDACLQTSCEYKDRKPYVIRYKMDGTLDKY